VGDVDRSECFSLSCFGSTGQAGLAALDLQQRRGWQPASTTARAGSCPVSRLPAGT